MIWLQVGLRRLRNALLQAMIGLHVSNQSNHDVKSFLNPFLRQQILDSPKPKEFADDPLNLMKLTESSPNGYKTLWEKDKLLVTSNFSFSHTVFKRLEPLTLKIQGKG